MLIIFTEENRTVNLDNFDELRLEETGNFAVPIVLVAVRHNPPTELPIREFRRVEEFEANRLYKEIRDAWAKRAASYNITASSFGRTPAYQQSSPSRGI